MGITALGRITVKFKTFQRQRRRKKKKLTCIYSYSIGNHLVKCDVFVKLSPQCSSTALGEKADLVLHHFYYYLQLTFWRGEERSSVHVKMEC